ELLDLERSQPAFQIRKRDKVVEQTREAPRLPLDDAEKARRGFAIVDPLNQRFGVAVQRAQRRAQLVREIRDKVRAQRLVRLELRDVVKDEYPRRAARGANLRGAGADVQRRG